MPVTVGVPLIVTVLEAKEPVTPEGSPLYVAPVAPVVEYVTGVIAVFTHLVWLPPLTNVTVFTGSTVIVPLAVEVPQPPARVMVYTKVPATVGVPLMVTVLDAQLPVTPAGKPAIAAPVAPLVEYVVVVRAVLMHLVCVPPAARVIELFGTTVTVI